MQEKSVEYPLMPEWDVAAIIVATDFYQAVEKIYQTGIKRAEFLSKYRLFLELEAAKMIQKQLDKRFKAATGMSIYAAVKYVSEHQENYVHIS